MLKISKAKAEKMSVTTIGILAWYQLGIDAKKQVSNNTYGRHRDILKAYGYDITKPLETV